MALREYSAAPMLAILAVPRSGDTPPQARSDRVLDLDVVPRQAELLGEMGGQRLHSEPLGRMMPRRDQMDSRAPARVC